MTRIRTDIDSDIQNRIRARTRRIPAVVLAMTALSSSAAAVVACGDSDPTTPEVDTADGAADAADSSVTPGDAGGQDEIDARADADADAGRPSYDASDEPVVCTTTPCVTQLAAGDRHFCALMSDGSVQCWGTDTKGSLGRGQDGGSPAGTPPQPVVEITNATQISAGTPGNTTCVRDAEKHVQCWGENSVAQLGLVPSPGLRDQNAHPTPTRVALASEVVRVDVGQSTVCAIATDGKIYCWGTNSSNQLARLNSNLGYEGPGLAELGNYEITRLILTQYSSFAITKDGQLLGWGRASGRLSSLPSSEGSPTPVPLPSLSDVTRAATSGFASGSNGHQCAIAGGDVYCWGGNIRGELGTGVPDGEQLPAFAGIITDAGVFPQQVALAPNRTCVRMTNGTLQCSGDDRLGQLGRGGDAGTFVSRFGPATALSQHVVQVASSTSATCALVQGGTVMCWGGNANGELGQGTTDKDPHPTPVTVVFQ